MKGLTWLFHQTHQFKVLMKLNGGSYFHTTLPHIAEDCVLDSQTEIPSVSGKANIEKFLIGLDQKIQERKIRLDVKRVESGDDVMLLIRKRGETKGFLVLPLLDEDKLVTRIEILDEDSHKYREFIDFAFLLPISDNDPIDKISDEENEVTIPDLYFEELYLFFGMSSYGGFDPGDGNHMYEDDWSEIFGLWEEFYATEDFDSLYAEWMEIWSHRVTPEKMIYFSERLKAVWNNKEYGRRLLEALKEYVDKYKDYCLYIW